MAQNKRLVSISSVKKMEKIVIFDSKCVTLVVSVFFSRVKE